jgi:hypothetical protein
VIGGRQPIRGRKLGDRRVRVERPHAAYFRWSGKGRMTAKAAACTPTTGAGRVFAALRRFFLGRPLASVEELGERLSKKKALAIFSSDAISSSAYATEEIVPILSGVSVLSPSIQVHRDRGPARDRRLQLPPGLHRLPQRRRFLLGLEGQPRAAGVAGRRVGAPHRLHAQPSRSRPRPSGRSRRHPALIDERVLIGVAAIALITIGNLRGVRRRATSSRSPPTCSSARRS